MKKIKLFFFKIKNKTYLKKEFKKICIFLNKNKFTIFGFISLYILDISTRIATSSIGFVSPFYLVPNLFSFLWIFFIIYIVKNLKSIYGKLIYGLYYAFSFIMFLVHNIYYNIYKIFFDFSILSAADEGSSYLLDALKNISLWMFPVMIISIVFIILSYRNFVKKTTNDFKYIIFVILCFFLLHTFLPLTLGSSTTELEWNAWSNKRNIYNTFNDNNKSMQIVGLFEYNIRNIYINYFREEEETNNV